MSFSTAHMGTVGGPDAGIKLMNLDATIMMDVPEALVARGIPCIGIHDSVVVPKRFGGDAQAEMEKSWALHAEGPTLCEIKGNSAILPHMRERERERER